MKTKQLTKETFLEKVYDYESNSSESAPKFLGNKPAVVDFFATWCGHCKIMSSIVEETAEAYDGKVDFYLVDVDREGELAAKYGIRSIPTFFFIPAEGKPTIMTGSMTREDFKNAVEAIVNK